VKIIWRQVRRFLILKVLHADDSPHRIAGGIAVGVFVGFTPTVGLQMVLAVAMAALLRVNKLVCIPIVWITNPFTLVPVYLACYKLGRFLVGSPGTGDVADPISTIQGIGAGARSVGLEGWLHLEFWKKLATSIMWLGLELWLGCVVVGLVGAVAAYIATRWTVTVFRRRREQLKSEQLARSAALRRPVNRPLPAQRPSA